MVFLRCLSSSECHSGVTPWSFTALSSVPPDCFADKSARDAWINRPNTDFHVYTLFEGVQSTLRLRGGSNADSNPPLLMHGFAVDYDTPMSPETVLKALHTLGETLPNWFEQTLSGNGRLVWMFEQPLRLPSRKFLLKLLEKIDSLIPFRQFPGIDEGAIKAPERYFTNGCRWTLISRKRIAASLLQGFVMKTSEKFDWLDADFGKATSLPDIAEECQKRFPRFAEWDGAFELGSVGPTFWVDGSTSPKSAVIRETGMQTFSAHASKAFYPWAEIVGKEFVENNESARLGKAVENVFFDGKNFIIHDGHGAFAFHSKDNLRMVLQNFRGLKGGRTKDGSLCEVDSAISHVLHYASVTGAASCAFYPKGVFTYNGSRILNTHQTETMQPAGEPTVWGSEGKFPFLSKFLDSFFNPSEVQLDRFLAWWQRFYRSCYDRRPTSGQSIFFCGPADSGKTFTNRGLIGVSVGGFADATSAMTGQDNFNSELYDKAHWVIDDGSVISDDRRHLLYSEKMKAMAANSDHRVNEKFRKAVTTPWQGRVGVTLNEDENSKRMIVNLDLSNLEKTILCRVKKPALEFLDRPLMESLRDRELPHLLRWLLDWTPPSHCVDGASPRYGVVPYAEETLLRSVNLSSGKVVFTEILTRWLTDFFEKHAPGAEFWIGNVTDLRMAMMADPVYYELLRSYRPEMLPRMLMTMHDKKVLPIEVQETLTERRFKFIRDDRFKKARATTDVVVSTNSVSFQKV